MIPLTCALSVQKKYDFPIDTYILNEIYKKIIGNEAIGLFFSLDAIFKKNKDNRIELIAFLKKENINNEKFNELKAKLESVDLIGAYTSESNDLLVILNQTKRIEEVFSNNEFNELLKSKCEQDEYEELKYRFDLFIPQNFINISSDISVLLEKNNIDTDLFKIENVQREINAYFKRIVIMPQEIKNLLINNWTVLGEEKIISLLTSLGLENKNEIIFDFNSLSSGINNLLNIGNNVLIIREAQLWSQHNFDQNKKNEIFNCYRSYAAEEYLGKIFPEELTQRIKKIFLNLRYSGIKDEVINMMIDFTLNKCHNLQSEYINKISNTIKAKGLNTIEKLYDHLTFKSNKNNEFIDKNYLVINKNIDW